MATRPNIVPPQMISGNKVLEAVGKLHVQLAAAEELIEQLRQNNGNLALALQDAMKENISLRTADNYEAPAKS